MNWAKLKLSSMVDLEFVFRFVCGSEPSNSSIIYHHVRDKAMLCNSLKIAWITIILLYIPIDGLFYEPCKKKDILNLFKSVMKNSIWSITSFRILRFTWRKTKRIPINSRYASHSHIHNSNIELISNSAHNKQQCKHTACKNEIHLIKSEGDMI